MDNNNNEKSAPVRIITQKFSFHTGRFVVSQYEMAIREYLWTSCPKLTGWDVQSQKAWLDGMVFVSLTGPEDYVQSVLKCLYQWLRL